MGFVNELIPDSEKDNFDFDVYVSHSGNRPTLWKWTIDRDRSVCLVCTKTEGGAYEGTRQTQHFALVMDCHPVIFSAVCRSEWDASGSRNLIWDVGDLNVPAVLVGREVEICAFIEEALDAMGDLYRRDRVKNVKVFFAV